MLRHMVVFRLRHARGSPEEAAFFAALEKLATIPGVANLETFREVSPKNGFEYGMSMQFADQSGFAGYNGHADHFAFVRDVWSRDVAEFQEIDLVAR